MIIIIFFISLGMFSIGVGGLMFASKKDFLQKANLTYLTNNFNNSDFNEDYSSDLDQLQNKIICLRSYPSVQKFAYDSYFEIIIKKCIYLKRLTEMCIIGKNMEKWTQKDYLIKKMFLRITFKIFCIFINYFK